MSAPRPPSADPPPETLDSSIDETAPPQRSPLAAALPFAGGRPTAQVGAAPGGAASALPATAPYGEETAPAQRSPLAAALPFRHARPAPPTMAVAMTTPEDLRRMAQGGAPAPAVAIASKELLPSERMKLEAARTVGFTMPADFTMPAVAGAPAATQAPPQGPSQAPPHVSQVPAGGGPVAASSTGHFGLSIEQYAALCAEVAVFPHAAEAIFAKYGLPSRKDRLTADLAWQDRLRADAALMQRWQTLYLHYHAHYHQAVRR